MPCASFCFAVRSVLGCGCGRYLWLRRSACSRHTLRQASGSSRPRDCSSTRCIVGSSWPSFRTRVWPMSIGRREALELAGAAGASVADPTARTRALSGWRAAVERMRRARTDDELGAADLEYHTAAVSAIDSRLIDHLYRNIQMQIRLTHAWARRSRGSRAQMVATHGAVVDQLRDADARVRRRYP